jgi:hypothetical protein
MADEIKKTTGSKLMNAFPTIAFAATLILVAVVWLELF